jgi:hypothetical protein
VQKARSLSDFADDESMEMLCIEPRNASDYAVDLAPGQQHKMKAVVSQCASSGGPENSRNAQSKRRIPCAQLSANH